MRVIIFILLALLSLVLSIFCFGILLVSCAGHPPTTVIGIWILPVSLLGGGTFLYLSLFFWRTRQYEPPGILTKESKALPKKIFIFFVSFMVATITFFLLSGLIVFLAVNTMLSDWIGYIIYALFTGVSIFAGVTTYKRFLKRTTVLK